jgi:hypothetical protein
MLSAFKGILFPILIGRRRKRRRRRRTYNTRNISKHYISIQNIHTS